MSELYRRVDVYKRGVDQVVIYRCFERLSDQYFFVQSADYFSADAESRERFIRQAWQTIELFLEDDIAERTAGYPTIQEAVSTFERSFNAPHNT